MKILIVDDSHPFIVALEAILKEAGYTDIRSAESASEAIGLLQENEPDLILMDVMMPEMDGIEAVRLIKSDKRYKDIPIVMVSVQDEEKRIEEAFEVGAIDYISKPIRKMELRARVRSVLKLKEEMDRRKEREKQLETTVNQLQLAMAELKTLSGLLPICANCKKIRNDSGYWEQVEYYVSKRLDVRFSHGICPDCARKLYPDIADKVLMRLEAGKK